MTTFAGSSAAQPDLDWSQLRETILMLNLAVAQIDQSMNEGHSSVSVLSQSFTALATNLRDIVNWRMNIAHVPQNIYLSDNSIEQNIAFGIILCLK